MFGEVPLDQLFELGMDRDSTLCCAATALRLTEESRARLAALFADEF